MGVSEQYLNQAKKMVDEIERLKRVSDDLKSVKYLIFAGMLAYYGREYTNDIYMVFYDTNFVYTDLPIESIVSSKYSISPELLAKLCDHCPGTYYDVLGYEIVNKKTGQFRVDFNKTIYVNRGLAETPDLLVERVGHQINHAMNSIKRRLLRKRGQIGARMGISLDYFGNRRNEVLDLEESINGLQIADIMGKIVEFATCDVLAPEIKNLLDEVRAGYQSRCEQVDDCMTSIVRPLYENERFNQVLVDARVAGIIGDILSEFDSKTSSGSFIEFLDVCDEMSMSGGPRTTDSNSSLEEKAKELVKRYIVNSEE